MNKLNGQLPDDPKRPMTNRQYLDLGGDSCPFCRSKDMDVLQLEADGNIAWQPVACKGCGETWTDEYRLIGYDRAPAETRHVNIETINNDMLHALEMVLDADGDLNAIDFNQIRDAVAIPAATLSAGKLVDAAMEDGSASIYEAQDGNTGFYASCGEFFSLFPDDVKAKEALGEYLLTEKMAPTGPPAEATVSLFSHDDKWVLLHFVQNEKGRVDTRETPAGEPVEHPRKAVFTNKDIHITVDGDHWRDIESGDRLEDIIVAMLSGASYETVYNLIYPLPDVLITLESKDKGCFVIYYSSFRGQVHYSSPGVKLHKVENRDEIAQLMLWPISGIDLATISTRPGPDLLDVEDILMSIEECPWDWEKLEDSEEIEKIVKELMSTNGVDLECINILCEILSGVKPICSCGDPHTGANSVIREYVNKDGEDSSSSIYCLGHYDQKGNFDPDQSVDLSGSRYDLLDESDVCNGCGGQL